MSCREQGFGAQRPRAKVLRLCRDWGGLAPPLISAPPDQRASAPVVHSFRARSGRLTFTVRRHTFNQDSILCCASVDGRGQRRSGDLARPLISTMGRGRGDQSTVPNPPEYFCLSDGSKGS